MQQRWFILTVGVISFGLLYLLSPILSPFLVGALLAYLSDPLADRLEARGLSRTAAVALVFLVLSTLVVVALLLLLPHLVTQVQLMIERVPRVLEVLNTQFFPFVEANLGVELSRPDIKQVAAILTQHWQATGSVATALLNSVTESGLAVVAWFANLVLIPVVTFYLLRDWDLMMARIGELLPRNIEPVVTLWARECDEVLGAFMKGQLVVMLVLGIIYAIGLALLGVDLALLLGVTAGLASIVPYLGVIVGIVSSGVAAYVQMQDPMILIGVAVVFGVGQLLEGMVLTPKLVGDRIGLHPVAVIFAIMAGGQLFGFVGVLLALPVAAVIRVLLSHLHRGYVASHLYTKPDTE
jgi:predicted PurR-regulated permease PerM